MSISPGRRPYRPSFSEPRTTKAATTTPPSDRTLPVGARCNSKSPVTISASLSPELTAFLTVKALSSSEDCVPGSQKDLIAFLDAKLPKTPLGEPIAKRLSDFVQQSCSFETTQVDDLAIMSRCLWLSGNTPIPVGDGKLDIAMLEEKIKTCLSTAAEADRASIHTDLHTSLHESHRHLIPGE